MDDELVMYTVEDMMTIFKIGRNKAYNLCKTKGFPTLKIGSKTLIPKTQLMKWIKENLECEIYLPWCYKLLLRRQGTYDTMFCKNLNHSINKDDRQILQMKDFLSTGKDLTAMWSKVTLFTAQHSTAQQICALLSLSLVRRTNYIY